MYIEQIRIGNFRVIRKSEVTFIHPDCPIKEKSNKFMNVNVFLGNNASGKTTVLKAVALCAISPILNSAGFIPYSLIRNTGSKGKQGKSSGIEALLTARFHLHNQDLSQSMIDVEFAENNTSRESCVRLFRRGDLEHAAGLGSGKGEMSLDMVWSEMFENNSPAFLVVGYGATRRVETIDNYDRASRGRQIVRYQRLRGLFEDNYSLIPLASWLPRLKSGNPGRFKQVVNLIDKLLPEPFGFQGQFQKSEYFFNHGTMPVSFDSLSDGYRSYIGWIGDLLHHICKGCPKGKKLVENKGIVMVDEVDLHLHPAWQRDVIPRLSRAFPNLQFLFTTHSPIVAGSVPSKNLIVIKSRGSQSHFTRLEQNVHGLNADQILISDYFGLDSTRAPGIRRKMAELNRRAMKGDGKASLELLKLLAAGDAE